MLSKNAVLPPQIPRALSFLDSKRMSDNPVQVFSKYTKQLGDTYSFHFGGVKNAIVTSSPEIIQHVLLKNYTNYQKSEIQVKRLGHFLGPGLLTSHGEYWLTQRRLIQEGFKKDKLVSYTKIMDQVVLEAIDDIDKRKENDPIDIASFMKDLTFKMVMRTLFSNSLAENDLKKIGVTISVVQQFILRTIVQPYLNPWFKISGELRKFENMVKESDKIIMGIVKNRRNSKDAQADMLQTLLDAKYKETGTGMTDEQIQMESMQLIVAGHETTSTALTWILYLLTQHPDCFKKVRDEINTLGDEGFDMNKFHKLEYTTQVVEESLRLYPSFWMIDRVSMKDDEANGYFIPKNTMVLVFIYGVQHSAKYWEEPEKFNPDRFSKQQAKNHLPFTHIPFGGGPRVCIGGNYAMIQMLMILTRLISKYEISLAQSEAAEIGPLIILRPKGKILMNLKRIK
jgi:cytochrome P450